MWYKLEFKLLTEIKIDKNKLLNNFLEINEIANIDIVKCYKILFTREGIINNIGYYKVSFILISLIILLFIFIFKGYQKLYYLITNIIAEKSILFNNNIKSNNIKNEKTKYKKKKKIKNQLDNSSKKFKVKKKILKGKKVISNPKKKKKNFKNMDSNKFNKLNIKSLTYKNLKPQENNIIPLIMLIVIKLKIISMIMK